jgi:hypothetical protein
MIRSMMTVLVLSTITSVSFAQETCNTKLSLTCEATYQTEYQALETLKASDSLADENWDEPSLANCAATVYLKTGNTSVRVHASKDLNNNTVTANSVASQIEDHMKNGQVVREGFNSNFASATSVVGGTLDLGTLKLARVLPNGVSEVSVKCTVK